MPPFLEPYERSEQTLEASLLASSSEYIPYGSYLLLTGFFKASATAASRSVLVLKTRMAFTEPGILPAWPSPNRSNPIRFGLVSRLHPWLLGILLRFSEDGVTGGPLEEPPLPNSFPGELDRLPGWDCETTLARLRPRLSAGVDATLVALPELCRLVRIRPKDAYDPGGKAAAELKGAAPEAADTLDLALAAAFTSISLRDRWRDPVVDTDLVLTVEALEAVLPVGLLLAESGRFRLS